MFLSKLLYYLICIIIIIIIVIKNSVFLNTGCRVWRKEELDLQSTAIRTSIWFWSPTSRVQEMFVRSRSKGPGLGGKLCQETGGKTGRATLILMDKACLFKSPPVTVELSQASTWRLVIGSLDRALKVVNFKN